MATLKMYQHQVLSLRHGGASSILPGEHRVAPYSLRKQSYCTWIKRPCMSKAFLFLNTLEDAEYAVQILGFPIELVPQAPIRSGERIRVHRAEELQNAYDRLCRNNVTGEFTALRV